MADFDVARRVGRGTPNAASHEVSSAPFRVALLLAASVSIGAAAQSPELAMREFASGQIKKGCRSHAPRTRGAAGC